MHGTTVCVGRAGHPKEAFPTERAARKALRSKRRFRNRRFPVTYRCGDHFHLTTPGVDLERGAVA